MPSPRPLAVRLAIARCDILQLLHHQPGVLLWTPGRAVWGLALTASPGRALLDPAGCLHIARDHWPGHLPDADDLPLAALIDALVPHLRLGRLDGRREHRWLGPDQEVLSDCCCIVDTSAFGWLVADPVLDRS